MIDHIFENIYIGEYSDTINPDALVQNKIHLIINLRGKPNPMSRKLFRDHYIRQIEVPITTDPDEDFLSFMQEVDRATLGLSLERFREGDRPVYAMTNIMVHCTAGMDRAPFVVALHLYQKCNMTFEKAYELVEEKRKGTPIKFHWDWYKKMIGEMKHCNGTKKVFQSIDGFLLECKICEEFASCLDTAQKIFPLMNMVSNYGRGVEEQRRGI